MISFTVQKLLSLIRSHWFIFVFIVIILGDGSKKMLLWFMSKSILPMFYSRIFIVSGLTFRSLIHFVFIFVYGVRECSNDITYVESKIYHKWTYVQNRNRLMDIENRLMVAKGDGGKKWDRREFRVGRCKLLHLKRISDSLLGPPSFSTPFSSHSLSPLFPSPSLSSPFTFSLLSLSAS